MLKQILNSKGHPIVLNEQQAARAAYWSLHIKNALGAEIDVTTLTAYVMKVSEQKFFKLPPANFMPVKVGEGAFSSNLETFLSSDLSGEFEQGNINTGANNTRIATVDAGIEGIQIPIKNWAKESGYNVFELATAMAAGNWDLVTARETARKRNWDLGIQKIAFLGSTGDPRVLGLLTQTGVTINTTTITKAIKDMSDVELTAFMKTILADYRENCAHTEWPSHFAIPESDFVGCAAPSSSAFPLKSKMDIMLETFRAITGRADFKILSCAYGDNSVSGLGVQRYALYNGVDETSLVMHLPLDYTPTAVNSLNGFTFQNVAMGQYCGPVALRPKEMLYFQF